MKKLVQLVLLCLAITAVASDFTENIMDFLNEQDAAFQVGKPEKVILLLGDTGTGKSTLALLLTDAILEATYDSNGGSLLLIKDKNEKIGTTTEISQTIIPEAFTDQQKNITYYDCPGFEDTRSAQYDITIGYLVEKLLTHAKSFKIVLVVNHSSVKIGETRSTFPNFIETIIKLFKHIDDYKNGIAMVTTKVIKTFRKVNDKRRILLNDTSVVKQVVDYIKQLKNETLQQKSRKDLPVKQQEFNEEKLKLINVLLENNNRTVNGYDRIGIFRVASKPGLLYNDSLIQKEKKNIRKIIRKNLEFVGQDKNKKYGLVVSSKSKVYVNDLIERTVDTKLLKDVSSIISGMKQYYKSILDEARDFTVLNSTLYESGNVLDGIESNETLTFTKEFVQKASNMIDDSLRNNTHKHIEYIEFLLKIEQKNLQTPETFTQQISNAKLYIKTQYDVNVDKYVKSLLQNTMFPIVKAISTEMQEFYTNVEKNATDVYLLREKLSKAHGDLSKVELSNPQSLVETIENLEITINPEHLNELKNLVRKLEEVPVLVEKYGKAIELSAFELRVVLKGLEETVSWYDYIIILDSNLPLHTVKTTPSETDTIQTIINACDNATTVNELSLNALSPFVPENSKQITILRDVHLNSEKKKKLKTLLSPFIQKPTILCSSEGNVMTVTGTVVRLSEVITNVTCFPDAKSIEIFTSISVIIDSSVKKTGTNLSIAIMSPIWTVIDSQTILLRGSDGKSKENAHDCYKNCSTEPDGEAGYPGETGGNFLGIGSVFLNGEKLTISSVGGNGGAGANGGRGSDGVNGSQPIFHDNELYEIRKYYVIPLEGRKKMKSYCDEKGFKYDEDKDGYDFVMSKTGTFGTNGGRGGHGGVGGFGGKPGLIKVVQLDKKFHFNDGSHGGTIGSHGRGKKGGNSAVKQFRLTHQFRWVTNYAYKIKLKEHEKLEEEGKTDHGTKGLDAFSTKNRLNPEPAHDFLNSSETIKKFKDYLINSSSGNIRESQTRKFIDEKLDNNAQVQRLLNQ